MSPTSKADFGLFSLDLEVPTPVSSRDSSFTTNAFYNSPAHPMGPNIGDFNDTSLSDDPLANNPYAGWRDFFRPYPSSHNSRWTQPLSASTSYGCAFSLRPSATDALDAQEVPSHTNLLKTESLISLFSNAGHPEAEQSQHHTHLHYEGPSSQASRGYGAGSNDVAQYQPPSVSYPTRGQTQIMEGGFSVATGSYQPSNAPSFLRAQDIPAQNTFSSNYQPCLNAEHHAAPLGLYSRQAMNPQDPMQYHDQAYVRLIHPSSSPLQQYSEQLMGLSSAFPKAYPCCLNGNPTNLKCTWLVSEEASNAKTKSFLDRHLKKFHYFHFKPTWKTARVPCPCPISDCGKTFLVNSTAKHFFDCHLKASRKTCELCGVGTSTTDGMKRHHTFFHSPKEAGIDEDTGGGNIPLLPVGQFASVSGSGQPEGTTKKNTRRIEDSVVLGEPDEQLGGSSSSGLVERRKKSIRNRRENVQRRY